MDWKSVSEIVFGKMLAKEIDPNAVNPQSLYPPYDMGHTMLVLGKSASQMIIDGVAYSAIEAAMSAAQVAESGKQMEWLKMLEQAASRSIGGKKLRKEAEKLEKGEEADMGVIMSVAAQIEQGYKELVPMSEVDPTEAVWIPTGYAPFDVEFGGLPDASLTVLAASPGVGKTSLMLKIARGMVKKHKKKSVAIFSLEMLLHQLTKRMLEVEPGITQDERSRLLLSEDVMGVQEIYSVASRLAATTQLSLVCIDFADQIVSGEQNEATMGLIYRTLAALAKRIGVPVLLLSQLNRETYTGGVPRINHIRYSGLAEAMSALIVLVYNPDSIFIDWKDQQLLPVVGGVAYLIEGKSRYGYKNGGPGAVQVDWDGATGWGSVSRGWFKLGGG